MSTKSINTEYYKNCPSCNTTLYYNNTSALNLSLRENKKCRQCSKLGKKMKKDHPETVDCICEKCNTSFTVDWKYRKQRFCSTVCMHAWRTDTAWTTTNCLECGTEFKHRKIQKRMFCSNKCNWKSESVNEKRGAKWKLNNPMNDVAKINKIKKTKLDRYGNSNYNNMDKTVTTMIDRYGVTSGFYLPSANSNGKRISKGQRTLYNEIVKQYPDAELEYYLEDINKMVDIYIPSKRKIIEYFGDYWHCNPIKYKADYYHTQHHKTANEIWQNDKERIKLFGDFGYDFQIVWESDK